MMPTFLYDLDKATRQHVEAWLEPPFSEETRHEVEHLLNENPSELMNAFYTTLSFGTGGLRGLMGIGTNRINTYTISFVTEGLSRYLKKFFPQKKLRVFIGYDCRLNSKTFAEEAAQVFAGNGIEVFLADDIVATPYTSFACRDLNCHAAIMVTASHNPKEYNGYKVYWQDGSQILSPHDAMIEKEAKEITSPSQVKKAESNSPLIQKVGNDLKQTYIDEITKFQTLKEETVKNGSRFKIVFANLHGTGIVYLPELLKKWGFTNFDTVKEQEAPDGSFPTVHFPNPEETSALELGIKTLLSLKGDLLIATDPDADRMRAGIRINDEVLLLNGNQIACLLLDHVLSFLKERNEIPSNGAVVKTIVTSELFAKIAAAYSVECVDVLTGFKYIGELIHQWENGSKTYLFGGEESYGTLRGTLSRDKDGVLGALLMAEVALKASLEGKTLKDRLEDLYKIYGNFHESLLCLTYPESKDGKEKMKKVMDQLRNHPPSHVDNVKIVSVADYFLRKKIDLKTGIETPLTLPTSDVLVFHLENGAKLVIRPSGTEPKIKIYVEVMGSAEDSNRLSEAFERQLQN